MAKMRKQYSKEFKLDAISLVLEQGFTRKEAAASLEINAKMMGRWIKEENRRLQMERDILKKATAFFPAETK